MNPNTNLDFDSLSFHEAESESRFLFPVILWSEKKIPNPILGHSMKPKTNLVFNSRTLSEAKNESRFWSSDTMRSRKRISFLIPGHYAKPKMNLDFDFWVLGEVKMNCDLASRVLSEAKSRFILASRRLREAKNELRFGSPDTQEAENESRFRFPDTQKAKNESRFRFPDTPKAQNESRFCFTECRWRQKWFSISMLKHPQKADQKPFLAASTSDDRKHELLYPFAEMMWFAEVDTDSLQWYSAKPHRRLWGLSLDTNEARKYFRFRCYEARWSPRVVYICSAEGSEVARKKLCGQSGVRGSFKYLFIFATP